MVDYLPYFEDQNHCVSGIVYHNYKSSLNEHTFLHAPLDLLRSVILKLTYIHSSACNHVCSGEQ